MLPGERDEGLRDACFAKLAALQRAYGDDEGLVAIDPEYRVHVSPRLLEFDDGPMLDVLKSFHGRTIELPRLRERRPDREHLAERFERFATV